MKLLFVFFISLFLVSCGSHWSELWIIPCLTGGGALWFYYVAYRASKSGSKWQDKNAPVGQQYKESDENVPIYKIGQFWFGVILTIATIVITIAINSDK